MYPCYHFSWNDSNFFAYLKYPALATAVMFIINWNRMMMRAWRLKSFIEPISWKNMYPAFRSNPKQKPHVNVELESSVIFEREQIHSFVQTNAQEAERSLDWPEIPVALVFSICCSWTRSVSETLGRVFWTTRRCKKVKWLNSCQSANDNKK